MRKTTKRGLARGRKFAEYDRNYTHKDFVSILRSVNIKEDPTGRTHLQFKSRIAGCACIFEMAASEQLQLITPGKRHDVLENLHAKMQAAAWALSATMNEPYLAGHLQDAANALARQGDDPDFIVRDYPDEIVMTARWPEARVLLQMPGYFDRALRIIKKATSQVKTGIGGNRSDETLHEIVRALAGIYEEFAASPRFPKGTGSAGSEFIKFLQACLRPLGRRKF